MTSSATKQEELATRSIPIHCAGLRILIVDDYTDSATSMALLLRMYGHEVQTAKNGPEALKQARDHELDVVLLDIGLPGMNGYDVARLLKEQQPAKTPLLIAMTGFGQEDDRRQSANAGIDLHLVKPIDPDELQAVLQKHYRVTYN